MLNIHTDITTCNTEESKRENRLGMHSKILLGFLDPLLFTLYFYHLLIFDLFAQMLASMSFAQIFLFETCNTLAYRASQILGVSCCAPVCASESLAICPNHYAYAKHGLQAHQYAIGVLRAFEACRVIFHARIALGTRPRDVLETFQIGTTKYKCLRKDC